MANDYLIEIHNYISEKIVFAEKCINATDKCNDRASQRFYEGQLADFQDYLITNFNPKLPRRIRQSFKLK